MAQRSLLEITNCCILIIIFVSIETFLSYLGQFQVFMMPNFALEDPDIFNNVLPWSMVTQEPADGARAVPRNSAKLLQEKVVITIVTRVQRT